jgi:hypothetical protein
MVLPFVMILMRILHSNYRGVGAVGFELGSTFYQHCNAFPAILDEVFPSLLYSAKVAKSPFKTSQGPDIMLLELSSTNVVGGDTITVTVQASDRARVVHNDDGRTLFATGGQGVSKLEIFLDNHPYATGSNADAIDSSGEEGASVTFNVVAPM